MAKQTQSKGSTPVVPNFKDVDKAAVQAAQAAVAGGRQEPLVVPQGAKVSVAGNGATYTRWNERAVITQAYRSVTKKGLLDVTVVVKLRQSEKNSGRKVFAHFYINNGDSVSESHESMNERSLGAITTLLVATSFMPAGGALKGTLLDKMFPQKGQPGTSSPLADKAVIANIVQQFGQAKDQKTQKPMVDENGEKVMEKRDSVETFLPDSGPVAADEDEDESSEEE
jgi:hypothetical protein